MIGMPEKLPPKDVGLDTSGQATLRERLRDDVSCGETFETATDENIGEITLKHIEAKRDRSQRNIPIQYLEVCGSPIREIILLSKGIECLTGHMNRTYSEHFKRGNAPKEILNLGELTHRKREIEALVGNGPYAEPETRGYGVFT